MALAMATAGCSTALNALDIENPEYSIRDIRPRVSVAIPFSASSIDFDFLVEVRNPNRVGLRVDQVDFDLLVNGAEVLRGISSEDVRIPASGTGEVRLKGRVGYDNIRTLFREVADAVQGRRAKYELRGTVHYDTPVGRMRFPLTVYRSEL